jgi:hypothetical protein
MGSPWGDSGETRRRVRCRRGMWVWRDNFLTPVFSILHPLPSKQSLLLCVYCCLYLILNCKMAPPRTEAQNAGGNAEEGPPPPRPLSFQDLPQDIRRTILFDVIKIKNNKQEVSSPQLADLCEVSAINPRPPFTPGPFTPPSHAVPSQPPPSALRPPPSALRPSPSALRPSPSPPQVSKQFRGDLLGPGAHVMFRCRGLNLGYSTDLESVTGLGLFLSRHIHNVRPEFIRERAKHPHSLRL